MIRLAALLALAFAAGASAQALNATTIGYQLPTHYEDGTPIQPGDITELRLYCRKGDEQLGDRAPYVIPGVSEDGTHETTKQDVLDEPGDYTCALTAVTTGDMESDYSNEGRLPWFRRPMAPTELIILVE